MGVPQNGWFIMENPIKMDDFGVPLFLETPIWCKKKRGGCFFFGVLLRVGLFFWMFSLEGSTIFLKPWEGSMIQISRQLFQNCCIPPKNLTCARVDQLPLFPYNRG